jgi:uncharacterized protein YabE (DUF348 family)
LTVGKIVFIILPEKEAFFIVIKTMKNLFSEPLRKKRLAVMFASFIVLIAASGFAMYETTKNTVALTIDGQKKTITTHATTVQGILDDLEISLHSEDYVFPSVNTKVKDQLEVVWKPAKRVELTVDNKKKTVWTTADTVAQFLTEQKLSANEHDKVIPKAEAKIKKGMEVRFQKAFPLSLVVGGKEERVWSTSTTVADFLVQQGITLNQLDRVEPNGDSFVKENDVINVIRVEKVTDVVEEPVDFAIVTQKDASLAKGTEKVLKEGQKGLLAKTFEVILENGKEVVRNLIGESTIAEKQDKVVAVGTMALAQQVSRGTPTGKEFYVSSTAYTAFCNGCSGVTATGINLRNNPTMKVIAVDPSIIPLGTKVYVEGYGYAIAADKGSAINGYKIDVFLPTNAEAFRWGKRKVKIQILE